MDSGGGSSQKEVHTDPGNKEQVDRIWEEISSTAINHFKNSFPERIVVREIESVSTPS